MKTKMWLLAAMTAGVVASCSYDDGIVVTNGESNKVSPVFSGVITGTQTRATERKWNTDNIIGITAGTGSTYFNVPYKVAAEGESGEFSAVNATIKYSGETSETFTAYFPYSNNTGMTAAAPSYIAANGNTAYVSTNATAQASPESIDFLWAKGVGSVANPKVNFVFRHMMSQITLNFKVGTATNLNGLSYTLGGLVLEGSFNTLTGEATAKSDADAADITMTPTTSASTTEVSQSLIFFPQDKSEISLKVLLGTSSALETTLKLPSATSKKLLNGYNVGYDITINNGILMASEGTIVGWNEQEGSLKAEPYGDITADKAQPLDLAMSDGTFVRVWDSDETKLANNIAAVENLDKVVGVVYWVGTSKDNPTTEDMILKEDHPKCTHGYILALNDMSDIIQWQSKTEQAMYKVQNDVNCEASPGNSAHKNYYMCTIEYYADNNTGDVSMLNMSLGYQCTKILRFYNYYYSDAEHKVHPIEKLDEYAETYEAPEGSTGWYLPSAKELVLLSSTPQSISFMTSYKDTQVMNINAILGKLLERNSSIEVLRGYYWSSSELEVYYESDDEYSDGYALNVTASTGYVDWADGKLSDYNTYSRAICAF